VKAQQNESKRSDLPDLFTSGDAARYLRCTGEWIRQLVLVGELKAHRTIGGRLILTRAALDDYRERQSNRAARAAVAR
jgi:excisionase family DNA binding protein